MRLAATRGVDALLADPSAAPELIALLPLVRRLRAFSRVDPIPVVNAVIERLAREPASVLAGGLAHTDRHVRRATFDMLDELGRLGAEHVETALGDRDLGVRLQAASKVGTERTADAARLRTKLCTNGSARLRARGLELTAKADPSDMAPLLRRALDDGAIGVRERARHLLSRQAPFDVRAHYVAQLERGHITRGVVLGLAEVGTPDDWERLVPALDASASIARAGIAGMRRMNASATRELRLVMVDDERPGVSREAARSVARELWDSDEALIRAYLSSSHPHVRANAILLASRLAGWRPASLLLSIEEPALRTRIQGAFRRWLGRRWLHSVGANETEARYVRERLRASTMIDEPTRRSALRLLALDEPADPPASS